MDRAPGDARRGSERDGPAGGPRRWALSTGSGKDATLALHRARAAGLDVVCGANVYDAGTGRVAFHGTRAELVREHCEALGLEPLLVPTEEGAFEATFLETLQLLRERGVHGVVFGNIHLADVRAWYEERVLDAGLAYEEPIWGEEPAELVRELVGLGYRARVVSVDLERGDRAWLGRTLDEALVREIEESGADPCGEHGEYHTFVSDGPAFRRPVATEQVAVHEMEGHAFLDLRPDGRDGP